MILIALVLAAAEPAERWVHAGGRPNAYADYVDSESIARSGDKVTLWTRRDSLVGQGTEWNELEFDCRRRTETVLAYVRDDGQSVSHNTVRPHRKAAPIPRGSLTERIFDIACR